MRKKRKNMTTQDKKKKLRERADKLFTLAVLKRWGRNCEICGKPATTAHHYVPKSLSQSLRYDLENGVPICNYCHMSIHTKNDPECIEKIINHRGKKWADYIDKNRRKKVKATVEYYRNNIYKLTDYLTVMKITIDCKNLTELLKP